MRWALPMVRSGGRREGGEGCEGERRRGERRGGEGEERGGEETKGPITCYFVCTVQCRICTYARA